MEFSGVVRYSTCSSVPVDSALALSGKSPNIRCTVDTDVLFDDGSEKVPTDYSSVVYRQDFNLTVSKPFLVGNHVVVFGRTAPGPAKSGNGTAEVWIAEDDGG